VGCSPAWLSPPPLPSCNLFPSEASSRTPRDHSGDSYILVYLKNLCAPDRPWAFVQDGPKATRINGFHVSSRTASGAAWPRDAPTAP